ncbi:MULTISPECIES: hypothetical protein [Gordonia]|uniref:hypothetical protein n=1 Tax=Gordonia TaxID=2053 RepID=UPI0005F0BD19|nr:MULTISPECIES: hypothetical protein [Gordonia]AUH70558.1 hypothetical protein CXX93_19265 [Gordonia sp. YC-JH1]KJR05504.1 hypothetical protein UG54_16230 [Gordonia sihwensis]WFN95181.1 hypothetical protein P5P27_20665 [Gordonia sihwensis]
MSQPTDTEPYEAPVCSSCAAAIVNCDFTGHEGFRFDLLMCFLAVAGPLVHDRTADVPDTFEWTCTGCHELCIGEAEWMTTRN